MELTAEELLLQRYKLNKESKEWSKDLESREKDRKRFARKYSLRNMKALNLEDYTLGNGRDDTFSRDIEFNYLSLGSMGNATAIKHGIYFGHSGEGSRKSWRFAKKWGASKDEAFDSIKSNIIKLIINGDKLSNNECEANLLAPMLKAKILYTYHPTVYLPIYSTDHLLYLVSELRLPVSDTNHFTLHEAILSYKKKSPFKDISTMEFARIFYDVMRPNKQDIEIAKQELLNTDFDIEFLGDTDDLGNPFIGKNRGKKGKGNYDSLNKDKKKLGEAGENIVLEAEKRKLEELGKPLWAKKIKHESQKNDGAGYDIQSFDKKGNKIFIEVKTTRNKIAKGRFFLSENERRVGEITANYYIYLVGNVYTKRPQIKIIKSPFKNKDYKVNLQPTNYRLSFKKK